MALNKVPTYGELFTVKEFNEMVEYGQITEDDGIGYWSDGEFYNDEVDVFNGTCPYFKTHVVWFNK